jgi:hypothetical protein
MPMQMGRDFVVCIDYSFQYSLFFYSDQNCSGNWTKFDGPHCYYLSEETATWPVARADCQARGGDLAVPRSKENEQRIYEAMKERKVSRVYIGVYRGTGDFRNKFYTVENDVETSYTNWAVDEPSNGGGHEDCVEIIVQTSGWNDFPCSGHPRHFICELKL